MKLLERLKAQRWAHSRLRELIDSGMSPQDAGEVVLSEGKEKFGAIDWATLLPMILQLITLLMDLFAK